MENVTLVIDTDAFNEAAEITAEAFDNLKRDLSNVRVISIGSGIERFNNRLGKSIFNDLIRDKLALIVEQEQTDLKSLIRGFEAQIISIDECCPVMTKPKQQAQWRLERNRHTYKGKRK